MCGIAGIMAFNEVGRMFMINLAKATSTIASRGPDNQSLFTDNYVGLGHRRLSIIDTSAAAHQPMTDPSGRYKIIFNGEIYNYKDIRCKLEDKGVLFNTHSDTEVLLQAYIIEGKKCLEILNGFFAFAIYDIQTQSIFIARDRLGIKPLYFYADEDKFIFGSELKVLTAFNIPKEIDTISVHHYLQLNYIAAPHSVLKEVHKLSPGECMTVKKKKWEIERYYEVKTKESNENYSKKKKTLKKLLEQSVEKRLISDVPLGAFLSGGIDSSVIVALASKFKSNLKTFSIGFSDNSYFDETNYAEKVAERYNTDHKTFKLSKKDLYKHLFDLLDSIDEPFADSSALPVYILSKLVSKEVKVALSGDGADELFAGYNKYKAENRFYQKNISNSIVTALSPLWKILPQSRNNKITNLFRQLDRFATGSKLTRKERYWRWCAYMDQMMANKALANFSNENQLYSSQRKNNYLTEIPNNSTNINHILKTDVNLVLANDMLTKIDKMSMAHGLEVRVPFLDHEVVNFAFSLHHKDKLSDGIGKRIIKDTFRDLLPKEVINRPKHGFEVPILDWLRNDLWEIIDQDLLSKETIKNQKLFDWESILSFKKKIKSSNPGDTHATIWALLVFQSWYKKHISNDASKNFNHYTKL